MRRSRRVLRGSYRQVGIMALLLVSLYLLGEILMLPFDHMRTLKMDNPSHTALMKERKQEAVEKGRRFTVRQHWVPLSAIPVHMRDAIIVAEDSRFYSHGGVDWHEVWESMKVNWDRGGLVRGGSTITQQVAKNLYLSTAKTPLRKFKELIIAWFLESQLTKHRILEIYLNCIEWGRGTFGVEAASRTYFHKSVRWVTKDEAVRLAAVLPNPLRYHPDSSQSYVIRKKQVLLRRLEARGRK